jgi:hypothetical protein
VYVDGTGVGGTGVGGTGVGGTGVGGGCAEIVSFKKIQQTFFLRTTIIITII